MPSPVHQRVAAAYAVSEAAAAFAVGIVQVHQSEHMPDFVAHRSKKVVLRERAECVYPPPVQGERRVELLQGRILRPYSVLYSAPFLASAGKIQHDAVNAAGRSVVEKVELCFVVYFGYGFDYGLVNQCVQHLGRVRSVM